MRDTETRHWTHPATILVATDLSDLSHLMPFAFEQAKENGARLILLHVVVPSAAVSADATGMPYYDTANAVGIAEQMLRPWQESARREGIPCDTLVREGNATHQIAAAVRQFQADCVLLGTRSRSKLGKLLVGSVAEQVLRSVYIPVITVGPEAHLKVNGDEGRIVLHATTLRETSRPSAALACQIASAQNAKLILVHVLPYLPGMGQQGVPADMDSAVMQEMRSFAQELGAGVCSSVEPVVVHGNPSIEILAQAAEHHASLIVLGAMRSVAFEELARDRTAYRVLAHARCPVLTLREPQAMPGETPEAAAAAHQ
jgi:nucleotide-binding universal stress UspA family protein